MFLEPIRVLSMAEMERIHEGALHVLERVGMRFESTRALAYLRKAGCSVDEQSCVVKFPKRIVQDAVDRMRRAYDNPDRLPARMSVRYAHIRFRKEPHRIHPDFTTSAGGFCVYIWDFQGRRRPATMDDVHRSIHLVNRLTDIDYTGLPVSDQEVPFRLRPVRMAAELAKYTTKFGGVETFRPEDVPYLIEIGSIVKGGLEALKREPILVGYSEAKSPLCLDSNMADIFVEYIERGLPQTLDTMPNGGATAPATAAGTLVVGVAETLGGLVLAYAIDENAVVGVDIIPSYCDMASGLFRYASADRMPLLVARVQMISEYYGCPSGVHGAKTDSCSPRKLPPMPTFSMVSSASVSSLTSIGLRILLMPRKISLSMTSCCGEKVTAFSRCPTTPIPTAPARTGNTVLMVLSMPAWTLTKQLSVLAPCTPLGHP